MPGVLWGRQHDWSFWLCPPSLGPPTASPLTWVRDAERPDRLLHPPTIACCKFRVIQQTWDSCYNHILNCLINKSAAALKLLLLIQARLSKVRDFNGTKCSLLFIYRGKCVCFCNYNMNKSTIRKCTKFLTDNFKITPTPCYSLLLTRKKKHFRTKVTEFLSFRANTEQNAI